MFVCTNITNIVNQKYPIFSESCPSVTSAGLQNARTWSLLLAAVLGLAGKLQWLSFLKRVRNDSLKPQSLSDIQVFAGLLHVPAPAVFPP